MGSRVVLSSEEMALVCQYVTDLTGAEVVPNEVVTLTTREISDESTCIDCLELNTAASRSLKGAGIVDVETLAVFPASWLLCLANVGKKTIENIEAELGPLPETMTHSAVQQIFQDDPGITLLKTLAKEGPKVLTYSFARANGYLRLRALDLVVTTPCPMQGAREQRFSWTITERGREVLKLYVISGS